MGSQGCVWCHPNIITSAFPLAALGVMQLLPSIRPSLCLFVFLSEQRNSLTWWLFFNFSHIVHIWLSKSGLHVRDVNVTIVYFKATLTFMGFLSGRRSALYECKSLVLIMWQSSFVFLLIWKIKKILEIKKLKIRQN